MPIDYEREALKLGISFYGKTELQLLRAIARKVGVATGGSRADLKTRLARHKRTHGYLKPAAPQKKAARGRTTSARRRAAARRRKQGQRRGRTTSAARRARRQGAQRQRRQHRQRRYSAIDLDRRRRRQSAGPRLSQVAPALAMQQKQTELLATCGAQCFGDATTDTMVPICPYCDTHRCYCHPECKELKQAYKHPSRNVDRDRVLYYAEQLGCSWLPPAYYRTEDKVKASSSKRPRRKSSMRPRRKSSKRPRRKSSTAAAIMAAAVKPPVSPRRSSGRRSAARANSTEILIREANRSILGRVFEYESEWYKVLRVHSDGTVTVVNTKGEKYKLELEDVLDLLLQAEQTE